MADIPMKSIQWPGLPDRYTFLQKASTLTDSDAGKAADAAVVGEALEQLQAAYEAADEVLGQRIDQLEAEIDTDSGEAPTLVAGTAEQLLSTTGAMNPTPYTYRANTSSSDRVTISQITGGTVAWHQMTSAKNTSIDPPRPDDNSPINLTNAEGGTRTFTSRPAFNYTTVTGHKYMLTWTVTNAVDGGGASGTGHDTYSGSCAGISIGTYNVANGNFGTAVEGDSAGAGHTTNVYIFLSQSANSPTGAMTVTNLMLFDLTRMFGAAVADYIYGLETATAGAGIALFRQMFPESYYPYNAGELLSVQTSGRKTVVFNQWDEEWAAGSISSTTGANISASNAIRSKNYVPVLPNTTYVATKTAGTQIRIHFYDSGKTFMPDVSLSITNDATKSFVTPSAARYLRFAYGNSTVPVTTYGHNICINLSDTSRNGQYEPYSAQTYPLDSTLELRGVPVLSGGVPAYDGDQYAPGGTVTRRYGIVDLGTLTWTRGETSEGSGVYRFRTAGITDVAVSTTKYIIPIGAYTHVNAIGGISNNKTIYLGQALFIHDDDYTTDASFKTAMSGVYLVYELATPTTETAAPYQEIQIAGSTEEFLPPATDTRAAAVPVGSQSLYQTNLRAGLETLLDTDLAHAESIAPVQGNTASTNIASGELLMRDGKLYKATQAIVAGAEIGSTNTTETTLAAQLAALEARIAALEN